MMTPRPEEVYTRFNIVICLNDDDTNYEVEAETCPS